MQMQRRSMEASSDTSYYDREAYDDWGSRSSLSQQEENVVDEFVDEEITQNRCLIALFCNFTGCLTLHAETQQCKHCCFTAGLDGGAIQADLAQALATPQTGMRHKHNRAAPSAAQFYVIKTNTTVTVKKRLKRAPPPSPPPSLSMCLSRVCMWSCCYTMRSTISTGTDSFTDLGLHDKKICTRNDSFTDHGFHKKHIKLCGEGKHREETCTNLRSNSMVRVKFPIRTGPAWELWPKPSCSERRPVPSSGTYIGWDDEKDKRRRPPPAGQLSLGE
ncbi:hypothetical protein MSG28_016156 [Choristoneura fumiferana]|uniref:Uncharacterized protein n=1 Tax=Choristoneura fumiferana TaxID=7141 RepID=A0ACC0K5D7_CHOFU|nr:hypothetical protein MSG28_016156 [Choristoneura fumiferana]